jgi:hypothetical protein
MNALRPQHAKPLRRLWWLNPAALFALVIGSTMLAASWQTDSAFELLGAPKFIAEKHVVLAALAIVVFLVGHCLAEATGKVPEPATAATDGLIERWFWLTTGLTIFGYFVWLGIGLKNGFSPAVLREFLTSDDPHLAETIRDDMFYTVHGVTTCTQFGVAAVLLGMWLVFRGKPHRIWPVIVLIMLAVGRALLFSERLAVIELVVPGLLVALRMAVLGRPLVSVWHWILQTTPILGIAALLLFFGTFEYFRSWRFYHQEFDSYTEFTLWRVSGYYVTAHNNSAMALETQPRYPLPYSTLRHLWSFPGLSRTPLGYTKLTGVDPVARHTAMLDRFGTPELNNEGGLFQPALDYGLAGYLLFWSGCGFVSGRLYRAYLVGTFAGVALYPLIIIAILETPRLLYLCYTRSFPPIVALLLISWLVARPLGSARAAQTALETA